MTEGPSSCVSREDLVEFASCVLRGEPYFGRLLGVVQGNPRRHLWFREVVVAAASRKRATVSGPVSVLEIGCYAGFSTASWFFALDSFCQDFQMTCVDPWRPYFTDADAGQIYAEMNASLQDDLVLRLFLHNMRAIGADGHIEVHRGTSAEILSTLSSQSFDVIFVDGSHAYVDVSEDLAHARRLISEFGIICGDDLEVQASELAQDELHRALESGREYWTSPDSGHAFHPGVTRAVHEAFGRVLERDGFWIAHDFSRAGAAPFFKNPWRPPHINLA